MARRVAREGLSKLVTADKKTSFAQMSGQKCPISAKAWRQEQRSSGVILRSPERVRDSERGAKCQDGRVWGSANPNPRSAGQARSQTEARARGRAGSGGRGGPGRSGGSVRVWASPSTQGHLLSGVSDSLRMDPTAPRQWGLKNAEAEGGLSEWRPSQQETDLPAACSLTTD